VVKLREMLSEQKFVCPDVPELHEQSTTKVIRVMKERHGQDWINWMAVMKLPGRDQSIPRGHFVFGILETVAGVQG